MGKLCFFILYRASSLVAIEHLIQFIYSILNALFSSERGKVYLCHLLVFGIIEMGRVLQAYLHRDCRVWVRPILIHGTLCEFDEFLNFALVECYLLSLSHAVSFSFLWLCFLL